MSSNYHGATQFPSLLTSVSDLYGASSLRMCESLEYALDLDALDHEELALEQMVQALVARKAPMPIGVKFHRAPPQCMHGLDVDEEERYIDEDVDNDDEEGDDMEEDELDDDDDAFPLDGRDSDGALASSDDDDPFAHERDSLNDDVSMDMDVEGEINDDANDDIEEEEERRRETW